MNLILECIGTSAAKGRNVILSNKLLKLTLKL